MSFFVLALTLYHVYKQKSQNYINKSHLYIVIGCKAASPMQTPQSSLKKSITPAIPEDISSRKTKSNHKGNKSQKNNSSQKRNAFQKREPSNVLPTQRSSKQQKNQRNHSVKQSKCSSEHEYHLLGKASKVSQEIDGKTQINKETLKLKNKEIQEELEHAELLRQGLVNSNDRKIKIGSRRRQIISHDILHPPVTLMATKQKKDKNEVKMAQISLTQSQKLDDQQYQEIVKDVKLNTLQSRIIHPPMIHIKKQEHFLAKIQESSSELISSPLHHKNTFNFTPKASPDLVESKTNVIRIDQEGSRNSRERSLFKMDSIQEEAINRSVERTFKQKEAHLAMNNDGNGVNIRINPCQSDSQQERITQKRSNNKVEQSKVIIATKVGSVKSNKKVEREVNKLKLVTGTIQENIKIQQKKNEEDEQQKKRLNEEISYLKSAVRELKLQKIKARAELSMTIDVSKDLLEDNNSRYETLNASIQENNQERGQNQGVVIFGKIKKNRSLSRKKGNYSMKSHELTAQKEMDLPDPLINTSKFPAKVKFDTFVSQKKVAHRDGLQQRQYKTMNLERINQQNIEQSMKFQGNFTTSINIPTFGSQLRSNKINMRGFEIGNDVLHKFQSSDRRFKHFMNQSSSKNRIKSLKGGQGQKRQTGSNPAEENAFDGVIVNNKPKIIPARNVNESARGIELESAHLIKQGEKIELIKAKRVFQVTKMPEVPQSPTYSTPTQDIMDLILKIIPYASIEYQPQDLSDCILKKYKNCIMFELKRFPNMKLVWYYSGKLYIGEWNTEKNEKTGYGKQFSKDKMYYQGHFKDNKRSGFGSFISESILYQGQWLNGQKQGSGKYSDLKENIFYEGEWKCDQKHGKGHFQSQTGIYYGMFSNDSKSGFGIELFKNGDRYIGFYNNGKFQGEGKYLWYNRSFYLGNFNAGFREGFGKWQSGLQNYELYIGEFLRDKKQGSGKYIWSNRCVYQGNFFNDLKHGLGSIFYPDGRYMQGVWTQGILTELISKVTQANRQEPLQQPRSRALRSKTFIRVMDLPL